MTYNMGIVGEGEPVFSADVHRALGHIQAASRKQFRAGTDAQRRAATAAMTAGLIELYKAHPNEFELTAGGMTTAQVAMSRLGMLDLDTQHDRWPRQAEFGVTDKMICAAAGEDGRETRELADFHAAQDTVRDKQAENPTGIPLYKLQTNDFWLVGPDEITAALGAYRTALSDSAQEPPHFWWPYWIEFLERAAHHGGFRVG